MKKFLLSLMAMFAFTASYADVLAELTFPGSNDKAVSSYTAEWTATNDYGTWTIFGFNNNNNGWAYIKCGRKNVESTASIETPVINGNVSDITFTVDKTTNVESATLQVFKAGEAINTKTVEWAAGDVVVSLTGVESGCSFKLLLENSSATANGPTQISKITVNGTKGEDPTDPVAVESVKLTDDKGVDVPAMLGLYLSESIQLKAVVTPDNATNKKVTWEVMQDSEVILFNNGKVTAKAPGKASVVVTTEDGEKQAAVTFYVTKPEAGTIADFIAEEGKTCYLTGVVSNIKNTTYGNFDLTDETGTIYVYGCLTPAFETKKFADLGIEEGDEIVVLASEYKLFNDVQEAVNVVFVENHGKPATYSFEINAGAENFTVTPSDATVMYLIDVLPEGIFEKYEIDDIDGYYDDMIEEYGSGLEYYKGVQTQSYEEDWWIDEDGVYEIRVFAVSPEYKRISEITMVKTPLVTSIQEIKTNDGKVVRINLAGQQVGANAKGVVIMNGKKVLVK